MNEWISELVSESPRMNIHKRRWWRPFVGERHTHTHTDTDTYSIILHGAQWLSAFRMPFPMCNVYVALLLCSFASPFESESAVQSMVDQPTNERKRNETTERKRSNWTRNTDRPPPIVALLFSFVSSRSVPFRLFDCRLWLPRLLLMLLMMMMMMMMLVARSLDVAMSVGAVQWQVRWAEHLETQLGDTTWTQREWMVNESQA